MRLRIVHTTGFKYAGKSTASFNEARMTPQTTSGQIVLHSRLDVQPSPWVYGYRDYWGTEVTAFEVFEPHERLTVTSTATVQTDRPAAVAPALTWADLETTAVADRFAEFLEVPERVAPPPELVTLAAEVRDRCDRPGDAAREICRLVHDKIEYERGSTSVTTQAAESWSRRRGVCQDLAHLVIGGLRSVGVPTRYVSGYLFPDADAPAGEPQVGQSHAWVSWWDEGWVGFDPTNLSEVGDHHVVVATGRDYADVTPLAGIYTGGEASDMFVDVHITRLA